jgi:outer membrane receptor protein involved in Fe transport
VLFSPQAGGPLAWDAPNRFLSWGWLPFTHKMDLAYTLDWRSGFPFTVQNDSQEVLGAPNSHRFPTYFSVDLSLERRFTFMGYQWALRGGVNNIFDRGNYSFVYSNVDSPHFGTFSGAQGHSFIARIRLLGRK